MKVKIFGFESSISVLKNIQEEFRNLQHEAVDYGSVDLIFHTTGFFEEAIKYHKQSPQAVKIFNLLDASPLDPHWPVQRAVAGLHEAHIRTTISETAKKHIANRTGIEDLIVIGYPVLPTITNLNYTKTIEFLWVGRVSGTKRFSLALETLRVLGVDANLMAVVGPERPPCGTYIGVLNQEDLNELYNSCRFCFLTSASEGLGLSAIESIISGGFPVLCSDNEVVGELGLQEFATEPIPHRLAQKVNEIYCNQDKYKAIAAPLAERFIQQFSVKTFVANVLTLYNDYVERQT